MAGYSGTPLPKKLGINPGCRLALINAPDGFSATLGSLPDGVCISTSARGAIDVAVVFVTRRVALERAFVKLEKAIFPAGAIWAAWPKKAAKVATDITEDTVREVCLPRGLVDVKVCAVDDIWSGLKLVWRKELRVMAQPSLLSRRSTT